MEHQPRAAALVLFYAAVGNGDAPNPVFNSIQPRSARLAAEQPLILAQRA
jgi:hypothetical protein